MKSILVDLQTQRHRLEQCRQCPKLKPANSILPMRCGVCHCVLKLKTKFKNQHCPLHKW